MSQRYTPPLRPAQFTANAPPLSPPSLHSLSLAPLPHELAPFLLPHSTLSPTEKRQLFTATFLKSAANGDADTLEWLCSIPTLSPRLSHSRNQSRNAARYSTTALASLSPFQANQAIHDIDDSCPRKWIHLESRDEQGNTALVLCAALGFAEGLRVLVEAGVDINGQDLSGGWTALHWAVQNNDLPLASYLVNHQAAASIRSHKGLRPRDLVKRGKEGAPMRQVLQSSEEATLERDRIQETFSRGWAQSSTIAEEGESNVANISARGRNGRSRSRASSVESATPRWNHVKEAAEETREREMLIRMELAMESARSLNVDLSVLGMNEQGVEEGLPTAGNPTDEDEEGIIDPFEWDSCPLDQMLVFAIDELDSIFDVIITKMKPVRTKSQRTIPANVIFLCARFAQYFGSTEMLEELFLGAIERIEMAVHNRPDDMANCAFWLSNSLLLLYYLRKESNLFRTTTEYQGHLNDLINEIFVFILRDVERRIDKVLAPAILDFEGLPGFEDVQFEGEWSSNRFVQKLTGRGKKGITKSVSAMSIFASPESPPGPPSPISIITPQLLPRAISLASVRPNDVSPRNITALLSSALFVLQIYQLPPAIIVQAFSQLYYWISCEIFNRILTQKKYLCRSKAMQIRHNASTLEEWARLNHMPSKLVPIHFAPVNHLLQFLQILSSENSIDSIIGTVQSLRSLNPLQLNRAVSSYRYEVSEGKMSEECVQYLLQIQKQWETLKKEAGEEGEAMALKKSASSNGCVEREENYGKFGHYVPPGGAEAVGELLNSRYMLPFAVPASAEMLFNFGRDVFGPFARPLPSNSPILPQSSAMTRLLSTSTTASYNIDGTIPDSFAALLPPTEHTDEHRYVPILPDGFLDNVLDAARLSVRRSRTGRRSSSIGEGASPLIGMSGMRDWSNWRDGMPGDDEEEDQEGDSSPSPSREENGVEETPTHSRATRRA